MDGIEWFFLNTKKTVHKFKKQIVKKAPKEITDKHVQGNVVLRKTWWTVNLALTHTEPFFFKNLTTIVGIICF